MIAFHAILCAYGFWLPNDPRGSWSTYVGSRKLHQFGGEATKMTSTRSVASSPHDASHRRAAKTHLKHTPVRFSGEQARSIVTGFEAVSVDAGYQVIALALMPTHLHAVIGDHERKPARVVGHLKRGATDQLIEDNIHPCLVDGWITHSCWAKQSWTVFIDSESHLQQALKYVEDNPVRDGLPRQRWSLVRRHRRAYFSGSARQAGRLTR